jgi:Tetratricopeptide repeat/Glycosyltransferase family 9 (heptosyltransferase)
MVTWRGDQILELAVSALKAGAFERAGDLCVQALRVKPELAEAWHVRGVCLLKEGRAFDALVYFDRSLSIREDQPDVWSNRGYAFAENGMWESARQSFQRALELANTATPHILCGGMFAHNMELEAAAREFEAALEIEPQNQDARVKLGVIYLGLGRWKEGFEQYHWRWFDTPFPPRPFRTFKPWEGQDLDYKAILLFSEQGYGDEIMALRFADSVQVRYPYARIFLEVRPTVKRLAEASFPGCEVLASGDQYKDPASIDYSCPLLDVPRLLTMSPADVWRPAYLTTAPKYGDEPDEFAKRLPAQGKLNVGLCWSSGRRPLQPETERSASAKSIPLEMLRPLMGIKGVNFVSLQVPKADIPRDMPIANFVEIIDDLHDTAQFIKNLDLVITVDTAVAHLAGALGKPVWNLVRFNGYWPWMREGMETEDTTIWYRSMRIFRQPSLGDWESVIRHVKNELEAQVS